MKLGLNLKPIGNWGGARWDDAHLKLARQLGCESVVAWTPLPAGDGVWHLNDLLGLKAKANSHGLELAAIENFHPLHWDKILLGEPGRDEQMDRLQQTIRNIGKAGIPCMGYNFSIVGVWGHQPKAPNGRGGAKLKSFDASRIPPEPPPRDPEVKSYCPMSHWNPTKDIPSADADEMWQRLTYFLKNLLPTAEEAGVKLAAHPDDPPVTELYGFYRCLHSVESLQRLLDLIPSPSNCLEFCQGTVSEMADVNILDAIRQFASQDKIAYVHFRNVSATIPKFAETFIDQGYVDMVAAMKMYRACGFQGTLVPDHTPELSFENPWETGMAYALGYMRACIQAADSADRTNIQSC
ncbi:MAG TPA: mannonate dehydratase [Tepidisphaeraceae bacterium]|nr:mannonate dehydratase [Tepidisphaeraceae bacterium]